MNNDQHEDDILNKTEFLITGKQSNLNQRLDKFLDLMLKNCSRSYIQKLIKQGHVLVNEEVVSKSYRLKKEDQVVIDPPKPEDLSFEPISMELDIVYEDKFLMIINKPADLVVHPDAHHRKETLVNGLLDYFDKLPVVNGVYRPGIVHRLDKDTTGALVVAKTEPVMKNLLKQFKEREVEKNYRAVACGVVPHDRGKIDAPIGRDENQRTRMIVRKNKSREAVTRFEVLARKNNYTYLNLKPKTGRTHQIRVHLEFMGFPLAGDKIYDNPGIYDKKQVGKNNNFIPYRPLLHAYQIGFNHPVKDKFVEFEVPVPEDIKEFWQEI